MRRIPLRLVVSLLAVIIVVVGAISYRAIMSHRISVLRTREAVLRADLIKMRKLIDQYAADKGSLPKSLDQLVSAGYLREIPEDPFTGKRDWVVVAGHDPNLAEGAEGIIDVHSAALDPSREGTLYKKWQQCTRRNKALQLTARQRVSEDSIRPDGAGMKVIAGGDAS